MNMVFLTVCCETYDTFYNNMRVCRKCGQSNPELIEVSRAEHFKCCSAPKDMGHMFGCPKSIENFKR
jgi:hypothetical protein